MRIDYFRYFSTIDRFRSISAAANFYKMRQNTLSTIVKQAEEEFGFKIFQRTPDGVVATPKGEEFIKLATEIDMDYSKMMSIKKQAKVKASVTVVLDPVTSAVLAMPLMDRFYKTGSRGNIRFVEAESCDIAKGVGDNGYALRIVRADEKIYESVVSYVDSNKYKTEKLAQDELCVVVSEQHELAGLSYVTPKQLSKYKIVWHQSINDEISSVLGNAVEAFESSRMFFCDKHLIKSVTEDKNAAIVSRITVEHEPFWVASKLRPIPLIETAKENRVDLLLMYNPIKIEIPRNKIMKNCILQHFGKGGE